MVVNRQNIQVVAWLILLLSVAAFLSFAVGGPLALRHYLRTATSAQDATVESKQGTLTLDDGSTQGTLAPADGRAKVAEGWAITTGDFGTAFVRFFDAEAGDDVPGSTLSLEPHSQLTLRRMRRASFGTGLEPPSIALLLQPTQRYAGGLTLGATWGSRRYFVDLRSLEGLTLGRVTMAPESRARIVYLDADRFRVTGITGAITVTNGTGQLVLGPEQRSDIAPGAPPSRPIKGTVNIVHDPSFDQLGLAGTWDFGRRGPVQDAPPGEAVVKTEDSRSILRFEREGSGGEPADLFFRQALGGRDADGQPQAYDVRHAGYVGIRASLRVLDQSVPGGGIGDSEYPLILRLRSIDRDATSPDGCEWMVGFYVLPPSEGMPAAASGEPVPAGEWIDFDSGNLLDETNRFAFGQRPRPCAQPTHLIRVEVGVSGHDYVGEIDRIEVHVE